jgi:hypothetical protein
MVQILSQRIDGAGCNPYNPIKRHFFSVARPYATPNKAFRFFYERPPKHKVECSNHSGRTKNTNKTLPFRGSRGFTRGAGLRAV